MKYLTEIEELKERSFPENYVNKKPHSEDPRFSFERIQKPDSWYGWNISMPIWNIFEITDVERWTQKKIGFEVHKPISGFSKAILYRDERIQKQIATYADEPFEAFELAVNEYRQIQK